MRGARFLLAVGYLLVAAGAIGFAAYSVQSERARLAQRIDDQAAQVRGQVDYMIGTAKVLVELMQKLAIDYRASRPDFSPPSDLFWRCGRSRMAATISISNRAASIRWISAI